MTATHAAHRPAPALLRAYLVRGFWLWLGTRTILLPTILYYFGPSAAWDFLSGGPAAAPMVVPLAVVVGLLDARRHGQRVLLANLGVSGRGLATILAPAAIAGELALWAITSAVGS